MRAEGHATGTEKAFAEAEQASTLQRVDAELRVLAYGFRARGTVGVNLDKGVANHANGGMLFEGGSDERELVGRPPIVAIESADDFAAALRDAMVECGSLARVGLSKNANMRREPGKNFRSAVGGPVIDDENFAVACGIILRQGARDGFVDEALVIVGVNQDADKGSYHSGITENPRNCEASQEKIQ